MSKLSLRDLVNMANDVAIESFGKSSFTFSSLWAKTWAKAKELRKEKIEDWIASFYIEMLSDPRFVYVGNEMWKLRDYMEFGEFAKIIGKSSKNISFSEKDIEEEDDLQEIKPSSQEKVEEGEIVDDEEVSDATPESEEEVINEEIDGGGDNNFQTNRVESSEEDGYE